MMHIAAFDVISMSGFDRLAGCVIGCKSGSNLVRIMHLQMQAAGGATGFDFAVIGLHDRVTHAPVNRFSAQFAISIRRSYAGVKKEDQRTNGKQIRDQEQKFSFSHSFLCSQALQSFANRLELIDATYKQKRTQRRRDAKVRKVFFTKSLRLRPAVAG